MARSELLVPAADIEAIRYCFSRLGQGQSALVTKEGFVSLPELPFFTPENTKFMIIQGELGLINGLFVSTDKFPNPICKMITEGIMIKLLSLLSPYTKHQGGATMATVACIFDEITRLADTIKKMTEHGQLKNEFRWGVILPGNLYFSTKPQIDREKDRDYSGVFQGCDFGFHLWSPPLSSDLSPSVVEDTYGRKNISTTTVYHGYYNLRPLGSSKERGFQQVLFSRVKFR